MAANGTPQNPDRPAPDSVPLRAATGDVVGPAHEVGAWRGPSRRAWLARIIDGAGIGLDQWADVAGERLPKPATPRRRSGGPRPT
jgi:hypothetical protein